MSGLDHGPQPVVSACDVARPRAALDEARVPEVSIGISYLGRKERRSLKLATAS